MTDGKAGLRFRIFGRDGGRLPISLRPRSVRRLGQVHGEVVHIQNQNVIAGGLCQRRSIHYNSDVLEGKTVFILGAGASHDYG